MSKIHKYDFLKKKKTVFFETFFSNDSSISPFFNVHFRQTLCISPYETRKSS